MEKNKLFCYNIYRIIFYCLFLLIILICHTAWRHQYLSTTNRWFTLCTTGSGRIRIQQQHLFFSLSQDVTLVLFFVPFHLAGFSSLARSDSPAACAICTYNATSEMLCVYVVEMGEEIAGQKVWRGGFYTHLRRRAQRFFKLIYRLMAVCLMSAFVS